MKSSLVKSELFLAYRQNYRDLVALQAFPKHSRMFYAALSFANYKAKLEFIKTHSRKYRPKLFENKRCLTIKRNID